MNRRLSALLVPLALAGCATLPRGSADEGLRARISYDRQGVNVTVSEPAHLAIVEVVPGRRVSLLYPAPPEDVPYPVAVSRNRLHFPGWTLFSFSVVSGRRSRAPLMYMIASRHPLNEDLLRDMQAGSGTLHTELLRSSDPARTMELLASAVVPGQPEADWEADVVRVYHRPHYVRRDFSEPRSGRRSDSGYEPRPSCPMTRGSSSSSSGHICDRPVVDRGPGTAPPLPGSQDGTKPTPR